MAGERWTAEDVSTYYAQHPEIARKGSSVPQDQRTASSETYDTGEENEVGFLGRVRRFARDHAWETYHTHRSDHSEPGFPDLVLVRETVLWVELKTNTGKLTKEQALWLSILAHAGQETHIWRPRDWPEIEARLTQKTNK
jgi:hypothetical protein